MQKACTSPAGAHPFSQPDDTALRAVEAMT
jgi:hypothetical protein